MKLSKIRTINSRIRRGDTSASTKKMIARAEQLGFITKSGYISKSKKVQEDKNLQKAFEEYEQEFYEEKTDPHYQHKRDFESLINEYVTPSQRWQALRASSTPRQYADKIISYISVYETFDKEYQEELIEYLENEFMELKR